jgi:putative oxygen-independent coproporphyrinogen III oxidase
MAELPPLSLYLHLPWCERKCPYCDFNSHPLTGQLPERDYIAALCSSIGQDSAGLQGRELVSVFIGGGTPSLLSGAALNELLGAVDSHFSLADGCEITIEANPGSSDAGRFAAYRAAGVNRLSLGIQSFDRQALLALGRIHDPDQARRACEAAHAAAFDAINLDLMYGLPGGSIEQGLADLEQAIAFDTHHISWYQLTIEPHTAFATAPPSLPDEESSWELEQSGLDRLAAAGFHHYEISAYAREGHRCRHNLNYWHYGDYIGIGAGAHGKVSHYRESELVVTRYRRHAHPSAYLAAPHERVDLRQIGREERVGEWALNGLRLVDGVATDQLDRYGVSMSDLDPAIERAVLAGLLEQETTRLRPTATGRAFLNDLIALFLESGATGSVAAGEIEARR